MASRTPNVFVSASNEFDHLARYMHDIELTQRQMQPAANVVQVQYSPSSEPRDADDFADQRNPDDELL